MHQYSVNCHFHYDFMSEAYQELFTRASGTPFQNPLWLTGLYATLTQQPFILTVHYAEKLVAVFPLVITHKHGLKRAEIADCGVSDYCDLVIDKAHIGKIPLSLLQNALPDIDILWADKVDSLSHAFDVGFHSFDKRFSAHRLPMGEDFQAWRDATYDGTTKRSIEKKTGKLSRKGKFLLEELTNEAHIRESFVSLIAFRAKRFAHVETSDLTQIQPFQDFYLDYAIKGIGTYARTYLLSLDDVPIAVSMGLNGDKSHHIVLLSYDTTGFANWSPGLVMIDQIALDMHKRGERLLDLTIGDEPYKFLFGVTSTPIVAKILPLSLKGKAYFMLYKFASRVKRMMKK